MNEMIYTVPTARELAEKEVTEFIANVNALFGENWEMEYNPPAEDGDCFVVAICPIREADTIRIRFNSEPLYDKEGRMWDYIKDYSAILLEDSYLLRQRQTSGNTFESLLYWLERWISDEWVPEVIDFNVGDTLYTLHDCYNARNHNEQIAVRGDQGVITHIYESGERCLIKFPNGKSAYTRLDWLTRRQPKPIEPVQNVPGATL